jgi:hypothetical protein
MYGKPFQAEEIENAMLEALNAAADTWAAHGN